MGSLRVRHDWAASLSLFTFMHWRRKWHPTPVLLPGESQGWGSLVGCPLWGRTESDMTEATYQQQQKQQVEGGSLKYLEAKVQQSVSCLLVPDSLWPRGLSPPGFSVHGILQARTLEWVDKSFSRGSSWPRSPSLLSDSLPSEPPQKPLDVTCSLIDWDLLRRWLEHRDKGIERGGI